MPKLSPWHSDKQSVRHDNNGCSDGSMIDPATLRTGTGDKPLCPACTKLDADGR